MTIKIGIPAQNQEDKFGVNTNYLEFIYNFGRPVVILPENYDDFKNIYKLDALVLPGGADIDYKRYSKLPKLQTNNPNIFLEHFDNEILPNLLGRMPIFGICRGLQTLNVAYKGTLKNLFWHPYSSYDSQEIHMVWNSNKINSTSWDKKNFDFKVNSFHHQAIGSIAPNFTVELMDYEDNVVEAISDFGKSIFAVQWHPERLMDRYSFAKFRQILS